MKNRCYEAENGQFDTAGKPVKVRICYCGTTGCQNLPNNDYPLPKDFPRNGEVSQEEEERFYKKVNGR